jgi:hypothetical protein
MKTRRTYETCNLVNCAICTALHNKRNDWNLCTGCEKALSYQRIMEEDMVC